MGVFSYFLLTEILLLSVLGKSTFRCYECKSRISIEDCDKNKIIKNCNESFVFLDDHEWWYPQFDRCLKIVDETLDPPLILRRCGFEGLYLSHIRNKCHKFLCGVEACFEPLCLIGGNDDQ